MSVNTGGGKTAGDQIADGGEWFHKTLKGLFR